MEGWEVAGLEEGVGLLRGVLVLRLEVEVWIDEENEDREGGGAG